MLNRWQSHYYVLMPALNGIYAYRNLFARAAELLQLMTRNHTSVDVNKQTVWAATWTFLGTNGIQLAPGFDIDKAERLVLDVATGAEQSVDTIAAALRTFAEH